MIKFYQYLLLVIIGFIIWVEYSVGNIFFRISGDGYKRINFSSLIHYLIHPLWNSFLWNRETLDVNFPFILFVSLIIYLGILTIQFQ